MDVIELIISFLPLYHIYLLSSEMVEFLPLLIREGKNRLKTDLEPLQLALTIDDVNIVKYYLYAVDRLFMPRTPKLRPLELLILSLNHQCVRIASFLMTKRHRHTSLLDKNVNWDLPIFYHSSRSFHQLLRKFMNRYSVDDSDTQDVTDSAYLARYRSIDNLTNYLQGLTKGWYVDSLLVLYPDNTEEILVDVKRWNTHYPGNVQLLIETAKDSDLLDEVIVDKNVPDTKLFEALDILRQDEEFEQDFHHYLPILSKYRPKLFNTRNFLAHRYMLARRNTLDLWSLLDKILDIRGCISSIPFSHLIDCTLMCGDDETYRRLQYYRIDVKDSNL